MVKKRLTDLLQEEAQKFTPAEGESAIEVTAEPVVEENAFFTEEASAQPLEPISTKRTNPTKADLEATVKELTDTLEKTHKKEVSLQQKIADLESNLSGQQALVERLTKELDETKKIALQLAEANSQLIEESNASKQAAKTSSKLIEETNALKQAAKTSSKLIEETNALKQRAEANSKLVKETSALTQPKENYNPMNYKKSHRSSERLAQNQPDNQHQVDYQPNESADTSNNEMWLLD